MPQMGSNIPEGDRMESSSERLRRREGIGRPRRRGDHDGADSNSAGRRRSRGGQHGEGGSTDRSRRRAEHHGQEGAADAGSTDAAARSRSPSELDDDEQYAGSLYTDDGSPQQGWRRKMFKRYWKRGLFGGGIAGLSIFGIMLFSSVAQGPLEFIHLAQLLEKFHFSSLEDAQDNRLQSIIRYIHDPSKPERTRLGIVGNIAADHLESKINAATGLKSEYNSSSARFEGYSVIRDNPQWKGMNSAEIRDSLVKQYGIDPSTIEISVSTNGKQSIKFNPDPGGWNSVKRYRAQTSFSRTLLTQAGYDKVPSHVGSRVLKARAGWDFHPIRALDGAIQAKALEGGKATWDKLKEKLKKQFNQQEAKYESTGDTSKPGGKPKAEDVKDSNGNPKPNPQGDAAAQAAQDIQTQAGQVDNTDQASRAKFSDYLNAKTIGAGAAGFGVGLLCIARNLNDSFPQEKQAKVLLPMSRKAGKAISVGSQGESGQDIDTTSMGIYKSDWLDQVNSKGQTVSTWNQARSIQAENGEPLNGPDLPKSDQVFTQQSPLAFVESIPGLAPVCGLLQSALGQAFSIVTGPVSYVVTGEILKQVIPIAADWLSGAPLNPVAAGAEFGNIVNYGARLGANDQFAAFGGVPLSAAQELTLKQTNDSIDQKEFASKSFAYKMFNTRDSRTLASHLIDNQDLTLPDNVASVFSGIGNMFATAMKMPATLISGTAHATPTTYNYHGLKKVGFTASELADTRFDDPFRNACQVVGCPDAKPHAIHGIFENSDKASKYTDLAKKCFGVNITNDGGQWKTDSLTESVNFQSQDYPTSDCESSSLEWLRVRFWLLDTATMEGYACYENLDDQSCQDLGFDNSTDGSGSSTGDTGTTGLPSNGGSGPFTTDTQHPPYPGVDAMLARAKKIGQTTAGPPFTAEVKKFCANFGGGDCSYLCESAAEWIWLNHRGVYPDPYNSSNSAWHTAVAAGHAHPGSRNPPIGALLIYSASGDDHGHVAVYVGDNLVFSTDILGGGGVYVAPAGLIESKWGMTYVGWMDPYFNGKVGN